MLSKKLLMGLAVLSIVSVASFDSQAASKSYGNMYASILGGAHFPVASDFKTDSGKIYGYDAKTGNINSAEGYKPHYKLSYLGGAAIGMSMSPLRMELEGHYSNAKVDDSDSHKHDNEFAIVDVNNTYKYKWDELTNMVGMLNVYYDLVGVLGDENSIIPYVGGGAGISHMKFHEITRNALSYQAKAGVSIGLSDEARVFVGYKYFGTMEGDKGFEAVAATSGGDAGKHNIKVPYSSHTIEAGVMVTFAY